MPGEAGEPGRDRGCRESHDPAPGRPACPHRRQRRERGEREGEDDEERTEDAPLARSRHRPTLLLRQRLLPLSPGLPVPLAFLLLEQIVLLGLSIHPGRSICSSVVASGEGMPGNGRYTPSPAQGRSSVGRAAVSKTVGRGFESLRPCTSSRAETRMEWRVLACQGASPLCRTDLEASPSGRDTISHPDEGSWIAPSVPTGSCMTASKIRLAVFAWKTWARLSGLPT